MVMPTEREQTTNQVVADAYTRVFDFCWKPISFVAGIFLSHEWLPRFGPWIIAARLGRWPHRVPDEEITDEVRKQVEMIRGSRRSRKSLNT
jgi:hypothetical protein